MFGRIKSLPRAWRERSGRRCTQCWHRPLRHHCSSGMNTWRFSLQQKPTFFLFFFNLKIQICFLDSQWILSIYKLALPPARIKFLKKKTHLSQLLPLWMNNFLGYVFSFYFFWGVSVLLSYLQVVLFRRDFLWGSEPTSALLVVRDSSSFVWHTNLPVNPSKWR